MAEESRFHKLTSEFSHDCVALNYDLDTNTHTCLFGHKTIKTCGKCLLRYGDTNITERFYRRYEECEVRNASEKKKTM